MPTEGLLARRQPHSPTIAPLPWKSRTGARSHKVYPRHTLADYTDERASFWAEIFVLRPWFAEISAYFSRHSAKRGNQW
jgi:hypothetical protein